MKKLTISALIVSLVMVSCKKQETKENMATTDSTQLAPKNETKTGDSTPISLDWNGTYTGKVPCASCPGIETTLVLNNDKTYSLTENYLEEKDGKMSEKGTFTFSEDGSFITLDNGSKEGTPRVYFVTEGAVYGAEKVGDKSQKTDYKLTKQ